MAGLQRYSGGVDGRSPVPPEGLRPAQLGVVLVGRPVPGHIGATIADLAVRGYLMLEERGADWVLTDLRTSAEPARGDLLGYEKELLEGLFDDGGVAVLGELGVPFVDVLDRVRGKLTADAVRNGRLRRWRRGKRTERGEELLAAIREFRRDLRTTAATVGLAAEHVPYAMALGVAHSAGPRLSSAISADPAARPGELAAEVPKSSSLWSPSNQQFGTAWLTTCSRLAEPHGGHLPGFAPALPEHEQSLAAYHQSHVAWSGGHGGHAGGGHH